MRSQSEVPEAFSCNRDVRLSNGWLMPRVYGREKA